MQENLYAYYACNWVKINTFLHTFLIPWLQENMYDDISICQFSHLPTYFKIGKVSIRLFCWALFKGGSSADYHHEKFVPLIPKFHFCKGRQSLSFKTLPMFAYATYLPAAMTSSWKFSYQNVNQPLVDYHPHTSWVTWEKRIFKYFLLMMKVVVNADDKWW